ncbi:hypothetical protein F5890DRAFT_1520688, partial [Lentinula detonsa]
GVFYAIVLLLLSRTRNGGNGGRVVVRITCLSKVFSLAHAALASNQQSRFHSSLVEAFEEFKKWDGNMYYWKARRVLAMETISSKYYGC